MVLIRVKNYFTDKYINAQSGYYRIGAKIEVIATSN